MSFWSDGSFGTLKKSFFRLFVFSFVFFPEGYKYGQMAHLKVLRSRFFAFLSFSWGIHIWSDGSVGGLELSFFRLFVFFPLGFTFCQMAPLEVLRCRFLSFCLFIFFPGGNKFWSDGSFRGLEMSLWSDGLFGGLEMSFSRLFVFFSGGV